MYRVSPTSLETYSIGMTINLPRLKAHVVDRDHSTIDVLVSLFWEKDCSGKFVLSQTRPQFLVVSRTVPAFL